MKVAGSRQIPKSAGILLLAVVFCVFSLPTHAAVSFSVYPSYPERELVTTLDERYSGMPMLSSRPCVKDIGIELTEDEKQWVSCLVNTPFGAGDMWGTVYTADGKRSTIAYVDNVLQDADGTTYVSSTSAVFTVGGRSYVGVKRSDGNTYLGMYYTPLSAEDFEERIIGGETVHVLRQQAPIFLNVAGLPLRISVSSVTASSNGLWMLVEGYANDEDEQNHLFSLYLVDTSNPSNARKLGTASGLAYADSAYVISDDGTVVVGSVMSEKGSVSRFMHKDLSGCPAMRGYTEATSCVVDTEMYAHIENAKVESPWDVKLDGTKTMNFMATLYEYDPLTGDDKAQIVRLKGAIGGIKKTDSSPTDPVSTPDTPVASRLELLALGDSYISGEGAEYVFGDTSGTSQYRNGTNQIYLSDGNRCHLSEVSYPLIIGKRLYKDEALYNSVACSGAETKHVIKDTVEGDESYKNQYGAYAYDRYKENYQEELDSIIDTFSPGSIAQYHFAEKYQPKRILLSVGGNDMAFSKIVTVCVVTLGDSCFDTTVERKSLLKMIYSRQQTLVDTYTKLKQTSPDSVVYVTGYPQIVTPAKTGCRLNVLLSLREREFAQELIKQINLVVQSAAARAGVNYVDISSAFSGRELCSGDPTAVNGLVGGDDMVKKVTIFGRELFEIDLLGNESYHPTAFGHILLASAVSGKTSDLSLQNPDPREWYLPGVGESDSFVSSADKIDAEPSNLAIIAITSSPILHTMRNIRVSLDAQIMDISPGELFSVEYHSKPTVAYEGVVPNDGKIDVSFMTPNLAPGAHELHVISRNTQGERVDVMQLVYMPHSENDYDGDGIVNTVDELPLVPQANSATFQFAGQKSSYSSQLSNPVEFLNQTSAPGASSGETLAVVSLPSNNLSLDSWQDSSNEESRDYSWLTYGVGALLVIALTGWLVRRRLGRMFQ